MDKLITAATIGETLRQAARQWPERLAYVDGPSRWTFREMDEQVDHLACGLLDLGLRRGDRIGLLGPNRASWLIVYFAAVRIGVCVVAASVRHRDRELRDMLARSDARGMFAARRCADVDMLDLIGSLRADLPRLEHVIALDEAADGRPELSQLLRTPVDAARLAQAIDVVRPSDPAMVIYTSGTTGRPKGAVLSHASFLATARAEADHLRVVPDDHLKMAMPLNHVGGVTCCILTLLLGGASCELVPEFKAEAVLQMMAARPPTLIIGVPTMLTLMLMKLETVPADLSRVRVVISGGANADEALLQRLQSVMPQAAVMNLYGMSEASGALVMTPWGSSREAVLSAVGAPLAGAEVRVVGPDGVDVAPGEVGELWFRGLGVGSGYLGQEEAPDTWAADGWLRTGDLGLIGDDGLIRLRGRLKEMFIQGGFNVYPVEVENVIVSHPKVLMVAGIGVPDPVLGEVGRYFVVPRQGSGLTAEELLVYCASRLADYKVPRQIVLRNELPMTPTGKVQKAALAHDLGP
jgi:acyl-CoA synthetase (AMP-forming)/AMP-acid ligase II